MISPETAIAALSATVDRSAIAARREAVGPTSCTGLGQLRDGEQDG